jgi:hypothetical protein
VIRSAIQVIRFINQTPFHSKNFARENHRKNGMLPSSFYHENLQNGIENHNTADLSSTNQDVRKKMGERGVQTVRGGM